MHFFVTETKLTNFSLKMYRHEFVSLSIEKTIPMKLNKNWSPEVKPLRHIHRPSENEGALYVGWSA